MKKLRIAWFSALNVQGDSASVSAYASEQLLPILSERFEFELFTSSFDRFQQYPTFHYLRAFERHRQNPFDLFFYQIEEGTSSHFTRFHSALQPGAVWFHDLIVSDAGPVPLYVSPWEKVVQKFKDPQTLWSERAEKSTHKGPLLYRESAFSGVSLFSTEHAHHEYRRLVKTRLVDAPSYFLAHPVDPGLTRIPHGALLQVAYCGSPRIEHRAQKVLPALAQIKTPYRLCWMVAADEEAQARALLAEFPPAEVELIIGRTPRRWSDIAKKSDVALHPLFSAYGQPGAYLAISLMCGVPSVVSSFGATEYLPESVVCKVRPGESESFETAEFLRRLLAPSAEGTALRGAMSERSRRFALEFYDRRHIAAELALVFESQAPFLKQYLERWEEFESQAKRAALQEAKDVLRRGHGAAVSSKELFGEDDFSWKQLVEPALKELGWS